MAGMEMAERRAKKKGLPFPNPGELIIIEAPWRAYYKKIKKIYEEFMKLSDQLVGK